MEKNVPSSRAPRGRPWLALGGLNDTERAMIEGLILEGAAEAVESVPAAVRDRLGPDAIALIRELSFQVSGKPTAILESTAQVGPIAPDTDPQVRKIRFERRFLRGFAFNRLGQYENAKLEWAQLERESEELYERFRPKIRVEDAIYKHNRGELNLAIEDLEALDAATVRSLDVYTQARLLGGLALNYIYTGQFAAADQCLTKQERLVVAHPNSPIFVASARVRITLLLERDEFAKARKKLEAIFDRCPPGGVNRAFMMQLQLRLFLAQNDIEQADRSLEALQDYTQSIQLPLGVLNYLDERVDLLLRMKKGRDAMNEITGALAEGEMRRDSYTQFKHLQFKGRVMALDSNYDAALRYMDEAINLGEARNYRPDLVWAFFHAAGISFRARLFVRFKMYLTRGHRLADQLSLKVRASCFAYLIDFHERKYDQASSLVSLLQHQEIGPEIEYFLDFYGVLNNVAISVGEGRHHETIQEPELRRRLFSQKGTFWFQREGVLVTNHGAGRITTVRFQVSSPILAGFRMLLGSRDGLRVKEFHQARSPHAFRDELHGSAAKMLISRIRAHIAPGQLTVDFDRATGRYHLNGAYPLLSIQAINDSAVGADQKAETNLDEELLQRISMETFVTTAALCEEFKMSRQRIHPYLKRLVESGAIRLIRRGPISGYRINAKPRRKGIV